MALRRKNKHGRTGARRTQPTAPQPTADREGWLTAHVRSVPTGVEIDGPGQGLISAFITAYTMKAGLERSQAVRTLRSVAERLEKARSKEGKEVYDLVVEFLRSLPDDEDTTTDGTEET